MKIVYKYVQAMKRLEVSEDMFPSFCLFYWRRWLKSILSYLGKIAVHLPRSARCKEICWGLYSPLWSILPISTSYSAICPHMGLLRMSARIPQQQQQKSWALQKLVAQVKTTSGQLWLMHLVPLTYAFGSFWYNCMYSLAAIFSVKTEKV